MIRHLIERLRTPAPRFFHRLMVGLFTAAAAAEAVKLAQPQLQTLGVEFPPWVLLQLDRVMAAGVLAGIVARLVNRHEPEPPAAPTP